MTTPNTQLLTAKTPLNPNLHLVDFDKAEPNTLQTLVEQSIDKANARLDELEKNDKAESVEQALADVLAFDHLGLDLDRSWGILSHLNSVMSNDDIRHAHHAVLPTLSAFSTRLGQHKGLFNRYQQLKDDAEFFASLPQPRKRAIELALRGFQLSGVALPADKQAEYGEIASQLSTLSAKFSDNVMDATQAFALPLSEAQLSGITDSGLALLAGAGEQYKAKLLAKANDEEKQAIQASIDALPTVDGKCYVATLDIPVYLAVITYADDRALRETLYKAFVTRASELDPHCNGKGEALNNADNMSQIMSLREQKAKLLGFDNYSQLSLATKMADSSEQVETFLRELAEKATPSGKQDIIDLKEKAVALGVIAKDEDIKPWDLSYVSEKLQQERFSLSQEEIRPYFPLPKVIDGLFKVVEKLYGIKAVEHSKDVPLWHEDVTFYQLYDLAKGGDKSDAESESNLIGGFYFDLYARQGKRGGAWMSGFQSKYATENANPQENQGANQASDYQQLPVCFMVGNFTPPTPPTEDNGNKKPSLLTHNEVITLFHEFGHGLHHLLTEVDVLGVSGISGVEWDAVELPSQFMENWAWDSEGIELISGHVETAEPLPADKLKALLDAKNFQSGMQTLRQVEFALFDLLAHTQTPAPDYDGLQSVLDKVRADIALMETPDYNRFANGFSHIFAGGYACGYFSYKWAELLSCDAFGKFEEEGVFNKETGKSFRDNILAVGGSRPAKENFENFRGREARVDALLRHSGFGV